MVELQNLIKAKIKWRIKNVYIQLVIFRNKFIPYSQRSSIIIFGSGRSGTTWLGEIFSNLNNATLIDEPLKNNDSYTVQKLGFSGWGQYIPEGDLDWREASEFFCRLFTGREINPNHLPNGLKGLRRTKWWILKFIRAHFLVPYLVQKFDINKPIFIIRNPYAVVASQLKHEGWGKGRPLELKHPIEMPCARYHEKLNEAYQESFSKVNRLEEYLALRWVMENEFIINHPFHNKKWMVISYEELLLNPKDQLKRLFEELQLKVNDKILNASKVISKSSKNNKSVIAEEEVEGQLLKWKDYLSSEQVLLIKGILDASSLKDLYSLDRTEPNYERLY